MSTTSPWRYNAQNSRERIATDMQGYLERPIPDTFDPDEISWVTPNLGVTDWEGAEEASLTGCYVINVAPELEGVTDKFDNITIGFSDFGGLGLKIALERCANHIHNKITENPDIRIVVHCAMGMERSPLAIAWYLHRRNRISLDDAYKKLVDARPIVLDRRGWI